MHEVPVTEARADLSDLISRVAYGGEPVVITRHGRPLVALVPAAYVAGDLPNGVEGTDRSAPLTVLDVAARGSGPLTIAAHQRGDHTTG